MPVSALAADEGSEEKTELFRTIEDMLSVDEIDQTIRGMVPLEYFSFQRILDDLISGEIKPDPGTICREIVSSAWKDISQQRELLIRLILLILLSAFFSGFANVFQKGHTKEISFFMMYLVIAVMLTGIFQSMTQLTDMILERILSFMKVLLPAWLAAIVFSSGTLSAGAVSGVMLGAFSIVEWGIRKILIPACNLYYILLIINQMSAEDYLSKGAALLEKAVNWGLKSVFALIVGLETVQTLITPAVDSFRNGMLHRAARVIPGVGGAVDAAAETIAGTALVIRNAVGTAGITVLFLICIVPLFRLLLMILLLRLVCAAVWPIGEKRLAESLECAAKGMELLLHVAGISVSIFMICLAIVSSAIRK